MNKEIIIAHRLLRQRLAQPVNTPADYRALFSLLQPVAPAYFSYPGSPPEMTHRVAFDGTALAGEMREERQLVKGRFLNKTIGYVLENELALYANAFCRPLEKMSWLQQRVYDALATTGPLTPRQLAEETSLLNKELMPILHRLQEAFLVYEEQLTSDWERGWYIFSSEWPEIEIAAALREEAAEKIIFRLLESQIFASQTQLKDWSAWSNKELEQRLSALSQQGKIRKISIDGLGEGWSRCADEQLPELTLAPSVFMLHKSDPLVRAHASDLKVKYRGEEILQYLLIDGTFQGAVIGHWRIGPHDVEDIQIDLSANEATVRREEIIAAVSYAYRPPFSNIISFNGEKVE